MRMRGRIKFRPPIGKGQSMYAALQYVNLHGRMYSPGEIIDVDLTDEQTERFFRICAIEKIDGAADEKTVPEPVDDSAIDEKEIVEEKTEVEPIVEISPEIDVMDGIVTKPKKAATKKTAARGKAK